MQGSAEAVRVSRLMQSRARELLIVMTATPLRRDRRYVVAFTQYRGVLGSDLRGLYRSTYRDSGGQQRYVPPSRAFIRLPEMEPGQHF